MKPPNIVVLNPNRLICDLMAARLSNLGASVRATDKPAEARNLISSGKADLVVFDLLMDAVNETQEFIDYARRANPSIGLVVLTPVPEPRLIGVNATKFPKDIAYICSSNPSALSQVEFAVHEALRGKYPRENRQHLQVQHALSTLSNSQLKVLIAIARGLSNQAIALERDTTIRAVENLIKRALGHLGLQPNAGLHSRVMATRIYLDVIGGKLPSN